MHTISLHSPWLRALDVVPDANAELPVLEHIALLVSMWLNNDPIGACLLWSLTSLKNLGKGPVFYGILAPGIYSFSFVYFWLCWIFVATQACLYFWWVGATLVAELRLITAVASFCCRSQALGCTGFSSWDFQALDQCFPGSSDGKESAYNSGDPGSIPGLGRSPGEGNGNPLQYSCLENSMDRRSWWATVRGIAESDRTEWLTHTHKLESTGLIVVVCGLSFSSACGIFPDQGSNSCLLLWQVDSLPLCHQGSPVPGV